MSPQPLRRRIGQLLIGSFAGSDVPVEMRSLAREFDVGGITFFGRLGNIETPEQVAGLAFDVRGLGREMPAWVGIDQEGGRVARLRAPFTEWPPMLVLGRSEDEALARKFGKALAAELTAVGISLDYAPVLDIHTNPRNPVIGDRALGENPDIVARLGRVIIEEMQSAGVAACGKHFPGHGDTSTDSHFELPLIEHPPDRIERVELVPFRAAIEARVASIMTAHILIPAYDPERPATLSSRIVDRILKQDLGYDGLVLSDDLEMKAISGRYGMAEATVAAIAAGCDAVLMCGTDQDRQARAIEAVIRAVEEERLPLERVEDALARHRRVKERFLARRSKPLAGAELRALLGRDEHQDIAAEMARFA